MRTVYVITHHRFNHRLGRLPIDSRFSHPGGHYVFYLIDREIPQALRRSNILHEKDVDLALATLGREHLAEWAFLLAEYQHGICSYPFFSISSRFYEKNHALKSDLNTEWESMFGYLENFGYGFLPSYDRPFNWIDVSQYLRDSVLPVQPSGVELIEKTFGITLPEDYPVFADLQCNYIGFATRQHLVDYVEYYLPLLRHFFNRDWSVRRSPLDYVALRGSYRNEKPLTFMLELFSHLYMSQRKLDYYALHYEGHLSVNDYLRTHRVLQGLSTPSIASAGPKERMLRALSAPWSPLRLVNDGLLGRRVKGALRRLSGKSMNRKTSFNPGQST